MKLYRMSTGSFVEEGGRFFEVEGVSWDELIATPGLLERARRAITGAPRSVHEDNALAPVVGQEVWAAGVTYYRSRSARIEESKGAGLFYDHVYQAERPELFFKANGHQVIGPGGTVRIRRDASWSVPEPEWTLVLNRAGEIVGYTIGNDMSSRDIEGENPLYLPQAKVYDGSCAIGPCVLLAEEPFSRATKIGIQIERGGAAVHTGETTLAELKREPKLLAEYLFRENSFPNGALLMTGTGIVPGDEFTLAHGDVIRIEIAGIGTLINTVG
ncbi:fumarylacetoacetate hydrolase family protein [Granulicella sp. S190]|uniref:fumarylacetoacetate hydrolase family protein n=1 Tax=Granulicella sp. S190 TaxID=1747226 RepID=UPI00131A8E35|nr:fumarylacetoacetate hydrolase family protein [Granulicella sp. S190]